MKKKLKYVKMLISIILICSMIFPSYATLTSSDGSFFVTKAEFDAALADFNSRLTMFEAGINSKIDSQVTSYLDRNGIWSGKEQTLISAWKWQEANDSGKSLWWTYTPFITGNDYYINTLQNGGAKSPLFPDELLCECNKSGLFFSLLLIPVRCAFYVTKSRPNTASNGQAQYNTRCNFLFWLTTNPLQAANTYSVVNLNIAQTKWAIGLPTTHASSYDSNYLYKPYTYSGNIRQIPTTNLQTNTKPTTDFQLTTNSINSAELCYILPITQPVLFFVSKGDKIYANGCYQEMFCSSQFFVPKANQENYASLSWASLKTTSDDAGVFALNAPKIY